VKEPKNKPKLKKLKTYHDIHFDPRIIC